MILWHALKVYGECAYRLGRDAGYYWALRAMCEWTGRDWYGNSCPHTFSRVGRIEL